MARFYRTVNPQKMQFANILPEKAMVGALQAKDDQIDAELEAVGNLEKYLNTKAFGEKDRKKRDELITGYDTEISDLASSIIDNPLASLEDPRALNDLRKRIYTDVTRGELAAIQSNALSREAYAKELEGKKYDEEHKRQLLNRYDTNFLKTGTSYESPEKYIGYQKGYISDDMEVYKETDALIKGMNESGYGNANWGVSQNGEGKYIITDKVTGKEIKEEDVRNAVKPIIYNNPKFTDYFGTRLREEIFNEDQVNSTRQGIEDYIIAKYAFKTREQTVTAKADDFSKMKMGGLYKKQLEAEPLAIRNNKEATYDAFAGGDIQTLIDKTEKGGYYDQEMTKIRGEMGVIFSRGIAQNSNYGNMTPEEQKKVEGELIEAIDTFLETGDKKSLDALDTKYGVNMTEAVEGGYFNRADKLRSEKENDESQYRAWQESVSPGVEKWEKEGMYKLSKDKEELKKNYEKELAKAQRGKQRQGGTAEYPVSRPSTPEEIAADVKVVEDKYIADLENLDAEYEKAYSGEGKENYTNSLVDKKLLKGEGISNVNVIVDEGVLWDGGSTAQEKAEYEVFNANMTKYYQKNLGTITNFTGATINVDGKLYSNASFSELMDKSIGGSFIAESVNDKGEVVDKNGQRIAGIKLNTVGINQNGVVNDGQALVFEGIITKDGEDISFQIFQPPEKLNYQPAKQYMNKTYPESVLATAETKAKIMGGKSGSVNVIQYNMGALNPKLKNFYVDKAGNSEARYYIKNGNEFTQIKRSQALNLLRETLR